MLLIIVEEEGVYKNNYLFNGGCWYSIYDNMYGEDLLQDPLMEINNYF